MVDSVSGSQRQQQVDSDLQQQQTSEAQKAKAKVVSSGFDSQNSVSRTGGPLIQLQGGESLTPLTISAPLPGATTVPPDDIKGLYIQAHAVEIRSDLTEALDITSQNNPQLLDSQVLSQFGSIHQQLHALEDISPEALSEIQDAARSIEGHARAGTLDSGKLEQLLMLIQSKLADESTQFSQHKIEIESQSKVQLHESRIEDIREQIQEVKEAKQNKALFALKIVASILFPPLGAWELTRLADRGISGQDTGLSIFSSAQANQQAAANIRAIGTKEHWDQLGQNLGENFGVLAPRETSDSSASGSSTHSHSSLDTATQGLDIAQTGLSQAEFMKLLQQIQAAEDSKEKLSEAIAALESGDPKSAAEILGSASDTLGLDSGTGENLTSGSTSSQQPGTPVNSDSGAAGATSQDSASLQNLIDNYTGQDSVENTDADYNRFMGEMSHVADDTQTSVNTAASQEALILRNSRV